MDQKETIKNLFQDIENIPIVIGRVIDEVNNTEELSTIAKFVAIENAEWSENMKCVENECGDFYFGYVCSNCKAVMERTKFCGNYGARMINY